MRQQLRYALEDIWDRRFNHFILFVQIFAALVLVSFIFLISLNVNSFKSKLNEIMMEQNEDIYINRDIDNIEKIDEINLAQDSIERQGELYRFLKENSSFKTYTADMQSSMWLSDSILDNSFALNPRNMPNAYFLLKIDEEFQSVFKLKCIKGRLFSQDNFKHTGSEIPLILGYDFQKYYDLDDIICDDDDQLYRVVGFLEKSSFYLNPSRGSLIYLLDKAFVIPLQPDRFEAWDYCSAINSTFIITDDSENLHDIQEKSNKLGLYTFESISFTDQLQYLLEANRFEVLTIGFIMTTTLIFSIIGFISNLIQFINIHMKEFAIHLLCGGRVISIIQRILIQIFFIILLSDIIVIAIHRFSMTTFLTITCSLLIGLIILVYPIMMLSRIQINNILRRSQ